MLKQINSKKILSLHPSAFLLAAQIFSLVLYAGFEELPSGRTIIGIAGVLVLALAVWVGGESQSRRKLDRLDACRLGAFVIHHFRIFSQQRFVDRRFYHRSDLIFLHSQ